MKPITFTPGDHTVPKTWTFAWGTSLRFFARAAFFAAIPLTAVPARAAVVNATFQASTEVAVTTASYSAAGNTVEFSLGFAPEPGATLKVVEVTGLDFIAGEFSNLGQGQVIELSSEGTDYRFVANYYGGAGNDLVLQWAYQRPVAWGYNFRGQLGTGGTNPARVPLPVDRTGVLAGKTVVAVSTGDCHSLALCSDGLVAAWGSNLPGRLGNDRTTSSSVPVLVTHSTATTFMNIGSGASPGHNLALLAAVPRFSESDDVLLGAP